MIIFTTLKQKDLAAVSAQQLFDHYANDRYQATAVQRFEQYTITGVHSIGVSIVPDQRVTHELGAAVGTYGGHRCSFPLIAIVIHAITKHLGRASLIELCLWTVVSTYL